MLLSYTAESALRLVQRWRRRGIYQRLEWVTNETLQLQRMAYEGVDSGGRWEQATTNVPVTEKNRLLAMLNIEDEDHPLLKSALLNQPPSKEHATENLENRLPLLLHEEQVLNGVLPNEAPELSLTMNSSQSTASDGYHSLQPAVSQEHSATPLVDSNDQSDSAQGEQMTLPQQFSGQKPIDASLADHSRHSESRYREQLVSPV